MQVVGTESPIDDLIHGVIQRSSQIVERITDQESKCIRNELADFDLNSIVSGFRIVVDAETVTAMCGKPVNLTVEIIDVLFGPLDLSVGRENMAFHSSSSSEMKWSRNWRSISPIAYSWTSIRMSMKAENSAKITSHASEVRGCIMPRIIRRSHAC